MISPTLLHTKHSLCTCSPQYREKMFIEPVYDSALNTLQFGRINYIYTQTLSNTVVSNFAA